MTFKGGGHDKICVDYNVRKTYDRQRDRHYSICLDTWVGEYNYVYYEYIEHGLLVIQTITLEQWRKIDHFKKFSD